MSARRKFSQVLFVRGTRDGAGTSEVAACGRGDRNEGQGVVARAGVQERDGRDLPRSHVEIDEVADLETETFAIEAEGRLDVFDAKNDMAET